MFCSSESCDSAIVGLSEGPSRQLIMETFYFLYGTLPLFTRVRGRGILRSSRAGRSKKFVLGWFVFEDVACLL
jgi:hypothetical protein